MNENDLSKQLDQAVYDIDRINDERNQQVRQTSEINLKSSVPTTFNYQNGGLKDSKPIFENTDDYDTGSNSKK